MTPALRVFYLFLPVLGQEIILWSLIAISPCSKSGEVYSTSYPDDYPAEECTTFVRLKIPRWTWQSLLHHTGPRSILNTWLQSFSWRIVLICFGSYKSICFFQIPPFPPPHPPLDNLFFLGTHLVMLWLYLIFGYSFHFAFMHQTHPHAHPTRLNPMCFWTFIVYLINHSVTSHVETTRLTRLYTQLSLRYDALLFPICL